jgi:hypothetical protein
MQSARLGLGPGMAAAPEPGGRTRFAHAEGTRTGFGRPLAPLLRHKMRKEIRTIERLARSDAAG